MSARRSRLLLAVVGVAFLAMVGCSDDGDTTTDKPRAGAAYALLRNDSWTLQEAVDPPADDPIASADRPPLAWYAEYVQTSASASRMVRVSGHLENFSESREELEQLGFTFAEVDVDGWEAAGSAASASSPALILLKNGEATIIGLSYEVDLEELATLAEDIEPVDEATWVGAEG